jgi:hypothetical protein
MLREGDMVSGGFEINLGSSFAHKRNEILGQWRQNHIAAKGLHVIDKGQIVDPASLPDGLPMTMELRQAIAAARASAGKILIKRNANGHISFNTVDYVKDPELDGIVAKPDWKAIGAHIDSLSAPPRYVPPVELASPGPERARELNAAFYASVLEDALMGFKTCREFAAWWMLENSCLQRIWKPEIQEEILTELSKLRHDFIDGHEGIAETSGNAKIFVVKAVVDLGEIAEQGVTFRHWFATHLCRGIADYLDIALDGHIAFKDAVKPADDVLVAMTQDNESVLIDSKMYAAIGLANGEIIESLKAAQVAVEDPTPLPHGIAVFKKPGGVFKEDHWAYGIRLKDIGRIAADEAARAHGTAVIAVAAAKQALEDYLKAPREPVLPEFAEEVTRAHDAKARELDEAVLKACAEEKELKAAKAEKTKLAKSGILEVTLSYTCVIDFADVFHGLRLTRNA